MIDDMDRAQAQEAYHRDMALAAVRERIAQAMSPRDARVDGLCIECHGAIEPARLAALRGCTSRCAECARNFEQRMQVVP